MRRQDWIPLSAASLIAGAIALALGAMLMPRGREGAADAVERVALHDERWFAVALLFFAASAGMTLGLPSVLTLFEGRGPGVASPGVRGHHWIRGSRLGVAGVVVFEVGCVGTAGFAMMMAFFRSLVLADAINLEHLQAATEESGLLLFLYGWLATFYLGEVLLGVALLRARSTPRWVPLLLIMHVATAPLQSALPERVRPLTVWLLALALCGAAIAANLRDAQPIAADLPVARDSNRRG